MRKSKLKLFIVSGAALICILIFLFIPIRNPKYHLAFEQYKKAQLDFLYADTSFKRQLKESGLGEKMRNSPAIDSFDYYYSLFSKYNDSTIKHNPDYSRRN